MSRRPIIPTAPQIPSAKDGRGAYLPPEAPPAAEDLSVDKLLMKGLLAIERTITGTLIEVTSCGGVKTPSREAIQNLKDCMAMLHEFRALEKELLEGLSDEELAERAQV